MGKQAAEPTSDSPEVLAWAEGKGLRIGSDGHVDPGYLEAYREEQQRKAALES